jgi:hypothetical protein
MQPARVAECRHEEEHLDRNTADLDTAFAEIDLQLLAGVGLKTQRRPRRGNQFPA